MMGFGRRGESQQTETNTETQVKIPWKIAVRSALSKDIKWLVFYLIIWAFWWTLVINNWEPGWRCSGWCQTWGGWRAAGRSWWGHMSRFGLMWFIPPLAMWWEPMQKLWEGTYHPRMLNPNYPAEAAQYDPTLWHPLHGTLDTAENENGELTWTIEGKVVDTDSGRILYTRFRTTNALGWWNFAKALTNWNPLLRCSFSFGSSRRFNIRDPEFTSVRTQMIVSGYARQQSTQRGNGRTTLTRTGKTFFRSMATTPPPQPTS